LGKSERKRLLERRKHMWEDNINIDLKEIYFAVFGWKYLIQNTVRAVL
jgi:hypothetical protein